MAMRKLWSWMKDGLGLKFASIGVTASVGAVAQEETKWSCCPVDVSVPVVATPAPATGTVTAATAIPVLSVAAMTATLPRRTSEARFEVGRLFRAVMMFVRSAGAAPLLREPQTSFSKLYIRV
ncbi:MAG TPA: hypothetical protein H9870_09540 [Candidatus Corynebacterium avicola]|uniref:Uncharacterized protein n=1 Tax=Candidatus Corynebacterium avicola TaxID=2838527 RepID=A0A9D1ULM3_9CORY|nr:hypothetical protein [Candidatus Corynebacterium avicola]